MNLRQSIPVFCALLALGCGDTIIDPFEGAERYYTVWGYLDAESTSHAVRVIPVSRFSGVVTDPHGPTAQIDATVVSIDLARGVETRWQHELEELSDGTWGHIFRADFPVRTRARYRLEVRRSDSMVAWAETRVPWVEIADLATPGELTVAEDGSRYQRVTISSRHEPFGLEVVYKVLENDNDWLHYVSYAGAGEATADGAWTLLVDLERDLPAARAFAIEKANDQVYVADDLPLALVSMGIRLKLTAEDWSPPGGVFDPAVLSNPDQLSNVENGYGFWGSHSLYEQEWSVTSEFSRSFGFDN